MLDWLLQPAYLVFKDENPRRVWLSARSEPLLAKHSELTDVLPVLRRTTRFGGLRSEPLNKPRRILPRFAELNRPSNGPSSTHGANQIARRTPEGLSNRFDQECFRRLHPYNSGAFTFQSVFHQRGISLPGNLGDAMTAFCWPRLTLDAATP